MPSTSRWHSTCFSMRGLIPMIGILAVAGMLSVEVCSMPSQVMDFLHSSNRHGLTILLIHNRLSAKSWHLFGVNSEQTEFSILPWPMSLFLKKRNIKSMITKKVEFCQKRCLMMPQKNPKKQQGKQVRNWWKSSQHQHQGVKNLAAAKAPRSHRPRRQQPPTQPRSLVGSTHWKSIFIMSIYAFLCISVIRHLEFPIYGSRYCEREGVREGANEMCSHMCVRLCFLFLNLYIIRVSAFVCYCVRVFVFLFVSWLFAGLSLVLLSSM